MKEKDSDKSKGRKRRSLYLDMPTAIDSFENLVLNNCIFIKKNPSFRASMQAAVIATDGLQNKKFDKNKSAFKIDSVVAALQAVNLANSSNLLPQVITTKEALELWD